jgi:transcriptional regulator with XRE-family HTH domain
MQSSGNKLKSLRIKYNFTQKEIAAYLNTSQSYIAKIENNKIQLKDDILVKLSLLYNLDKKYLLGEETELKYNFRSNVQNLNLNSVVEMNKIIKNIEYLEEKVDDME